MYTIAHWKTNDCITHDYYSHKDLQGQYTYQAFQKQYNFGTWCENLTGAAETVETADGVNFMTRQQLVNASE